MFLNDILAWHRILEWQLFSFSTLICDYIVFHLWNFSWQVRWKSFYLRCQIYISCSRFFEGFLFIDEDFGYITESIFANSVFSLSLLGAPWIFGLLCDALFWWIYYKRWKILTFVLRNQLILYIWILLYLPKNLVKITAPADCH